MMTTIKRWKIEVNFGHDRNTILFIHDNHYSNVIRKLAEVDYSTEPYWVKVSSDTGSNLNMALENRVCKPENG